MASGDISGRDCKETQEENQQSVKVEERHQVVVRNAKRGHKQASKSGPNLWVDGVNLASSPIKQEPTLNYHSEAGLIKIIEGELNWIDIALDNLGPNTYIAKREILTCILKIEYHLASCNLDGNFMKRCDHLIRNRLTPLAIMIKRNNDIAQLDKEYQKLLSNMGMLRKEAEANGRTNT